MRNLAATAAKYDKEARSGVYTHALRSDSQDPRVGGNMTKSYPRRGLEGADPRDEMMRVKMELIKEGKVTGMTKFGQVTVTEADLQWLQKKRDQEAKFNFDRWVGENFHTNDVVGRAWLQKTYPEYYDEREQVMIDRAKFALRVNLLQLRGPKNQKDLVLYWGLQQGLVKLDRDWDRIGAGIGSNVSPQAIAAEQTRFRNGLMNPWKYKSDSERISNQSAGDNPFQPTGSFIRQMAPDQGGVPGGFGINVPDTKRYPNFLDSVLSPSLYGSANAGVAGL